MNVNETENQTRLRRAKEALTAAAIRSLQEKETWMRNQASGAAPSEAVSASHAFRMSANILKEIRESMELEALKDRCRTRIGG